MDARHHDVFRSPLCQFSAHLFQLLNRSPVLRIRRIDQCAEFCQVRRDDIRVVNQFFHLFAHLFRVRPIQLPIVSHDRIDDDKVAVRLKMADKIKHDIHLLFRS